MFRKFRKWMNFNPPYALSADGWADFKEEFKRKAPIRHFMTEVVGWKFHMLGYRLKNAIWWIRHRTTNRYHVVKTGLEPGWHDTDTKLLYTSFTMLVDYVEQECAGMHLSCRTETRNEVLGWQRYLPSVLRMSFREMRNREAGLAHLDWEITLDDPSLPPDEQNPHQAEKARAVKALYLWWTEVRPARKEIPHPLENTERQGMEILSQRWKDANPEKEALVRDWATQVNVQEMAWDEEDTLMLIKLIKIRKGLWT